MDFGSASKPAATVVPVAAPTRPDASSAGRAVSATEMPASRAVAQPRETLGVSLDLTPGAERGAALDAVMQRLVRSTEVDAQTRAVVFRAVDERTGDVVSQFPSEQILKLRAYLRNEADAAAATGRAQGRVDG